MATLAVACMLVKAAGTDEKPKDKRSNLETLISCKFQRFPYSLIVFWLIDPSR